MPSPAWRTERLAIERLHCSTCRVKIEGSLENLDGIEAAVISVAGGYLNVTYDAKRISSEWIRQRIETLGYTASEATGTGTVKGSPPRCTRHRVTSEGTPSWARS